MKNVLIITVVSLFISVQALAAKSDNVPIPLKPNPEKTIGKKTVAGNYYYVATTGLDQAGSGAEDKPFKTVAYAAKQVVANQNHTIYIKPGTYYETEAIIVKPGVNIQGASKASVIITSANAIPSSGVNVNSEQFHLWVEGSLIQLASPVYPGANIKNGAISEMIAPTNGNQTISELTLDGNAKKIKAGIWTENRNNVTVHDVLFKDFNIHGAVFSRGDMVWYQPIPEGKWMKNTTGYNLTFVNCAKDDVSSTTGNLGLGGLDGGDFYNITITENQGYGIKFKHVGHFRNVKIHDCTIAVPETDARWSEDISIELWNLSYDNEIYNVVCNTWLSLVNHVQFNDYQPTTAHPVNLKVKNVRMIDNDGSSVKEAIECALSGVEISDCYIQDKGFGIAIWGGTAWGGTIAHHDINIHNNIFTNVSRSIQYGFGSSTAVFIPDPANNITIHNNIFDRMGNSLQLDSGNAISIKNNTFINSGGDDVQGGSNLFFTNNLRFNSSSQKPNWVVSTTVNATNIQGNPQYKNTGNRWDEYYKPASVTSFAVDKGVNVGIAFSGTAPDIGAFEIGPNAISINAPTSFIASTILSGTATLTWADNSNNETAFILERRNTIAGGNYELVQTLPANTLTFTDASLLPSTSYQYRLLAKNATQQSDYTYIETAFTTLADTGNGLQATYYDTIDLTGTQLNRIDATVNFNWGSGSPDVSIGVDTFSARWKGQVMPQFTEVYTFYTSTDDGVRLWVNGVLLVDKWINQSPTTHSGTIALTGGQKYDIVIEYYENAGGAVAQLSWSSVSQVKQIIPSINLYPTSGTALKEVTQDTARLTLENDTAFNKGLSLYPNPAKEQLNIIFHSETENEAFVELVNMNAMVVNRTLIKSTKGNNAVTLDVSHLAPGIYIVNLKSGSRKVAKKVIVTK